MMRLMELFYYDVGNDKQGVKKNIHACLLLELKTKCSAIHFFD